MAWQGCATSATLARTSGDCAWHAAEEEAEEEEEEERERERLSTGAGQAPGLLPQEQSIARMKETKKETLSRGSWTMC